MLKLNILIKDKQNVEKTSKFILKGGLYDILKI